MTCRCNFARRSHRHCFFCGISIINRNDIEKHVRLKHPDQLTRGLSMQDKKPNKGVGINAENERKHAEDVQLSEEHDGQCQGDDGRLVCYKQVDEVVECVDVREEAQVSSLYPHFNEVERGVYWFHVVRLPVRPSVRPSARLWTESCLLCIFNNTSRIHFIFTHLIRQLQKMCRVSCL